MRADGVDAIVGQWQRERPDLEELTAMSVYGRIYRIATAMGEQMEKAYAPFGIGRGEFDVLATLRRSGEPFVLSPKQLSETLMLTTGGMTGRLDKLEKAGLLKRSPDPADRRALRVQLTDAGRKVIDDAVAAGLEVQQAALGRLDPADAQRLDGLLRELLAASKA